jgi:8-oxo-dGTP pyrophosphatase MutT (NUDIX family)
MDEAPQVQSAGAVVVADSPQGLRVALLHRREPGEWRLAKGKLHPGETSEQAAEREVAEELGVQVQVGDRIGETRYTYLLPSGPVGKSVVFFLARLAALAPLTPEERNFDQAVWVAPGEALQRLSWENERKMVWLALASLPDQKGESC